MIELPGFLKRKAQSKADQASESDSDLKKVWKTVTLGKIEDALAMVETVIARDKANPDAWMAKGAILEMLKRPGEARLAYEKAGSLGCKEGARRAAQLGASGY